MEFSLLGASPIVAFNNLVGLLFSIAYFYQMVYIVISLVRGNIRLPKAKVRHRYAYFIAAHNEEAVIANLVRSILEQNYPAELIDCFVVADACTDETAKRAREAGAIVYERNDLARKGKSWVMATSYAPAIATPRTSTPAGSARALPCGTCARRASSTTCA